MSLELKQRAKHLTVYLETARRWNSWKPRVREKRPASSYLNLSARSQSGGVTIKSNLLPVGLSLLLLDVNTILSGVAN